MVVVSHLFFFFAKSFRGRCDSHESHRPLLGTIYFPTAPSSFFVPGNGAGKSKLHSDIKREGDHEHFTCRRFIRIDEPDDTKI